MKDQYDNLSKLTKMKIIMYHKVGLSRIFFPPLRVSSKVKAALVASKAKLVSI